MKRIILFFILIITICSCEKSKGSNEIKVTFSVTEFKWEGHEYLERYRGGMIHSESCSNISHKKQLK